MSPIRADGRVIHPLYLFEVKVPTESKYPWDYVKLISTTPADEAFRPLAQSECFPLVKNCLIGSARTIGWIRGI